MFDQLRIDLAPIIDMTTTLTTEAKTILAAVDSIEEAKRKLLLSTSGESSQAAANRMDDLANKLLARAGKLTRNADVLKNLAKLYDEADLAGSRAFGP